MNPSHSLFDKVSFAADTVHDRLRAVAVEWSAAGVSLPLFAALTDFVDSDRKLSGTPCEVAATGEFLRLCGRAVTSDPKALLATTPSGDSLEAVVAVMVEVLVSAASERSVPLVHRYPHELPVPTRLRLEALGITSAACTPELQSSVWSGLRGAHAVALAAQSCGQPWPGRPAEEFVNLAVDIEAATTAAFAPPWHPVSPVASLNDNDELRRIELPAVGLLYMLDAGLGAGSRWMTEHAAKAVASLVTSSGDLLSGTPDRHCWPGEVHLAALCLQSNGFEAEAKLLSGRLCEQMRDRPVAFWFPESAAETTRELSTWSLSAASANGISYTRDER
jgi:hypothetical protein